MRSLVKIHLGFAAVLGFSVLHPCAPTARAQAQQAQANASSPSSSAASSATPLQKSVEAFLRHLYAFGPDFAVRIGVPKEIGIENLLETEVEVRSSQGVQTGKVYVTKDGRYMFRGELSDLTKDPLAEARAQLQINNAPSMGDPKAPVTLVEFSDFECPVCKSLHDLLRDMLPSYPQVRVVFKDYPLEQLHPWARTAAIGGRCAFQQDQKAFWKFYDLVYDNQDIVSPENAWTKMQDYAGQAGLNQDAFKACMAGPEAAAAVDASRANGQKLEVNSTPTIFVNGRRMSGADPHLLEQYIKYELDELKLRSQNKAN
jgi:protein-disulfide isomerase